MKKFLSLVIMIILCFNTFAVGAYNKVDESNKSKAIKELIVSKYELKNSYKGRKYMTIIDKFIDKNKLNEQKLTEIYDKINPILEEGKIKNKETLNILKYMNSKIVINLVEFYNVSELENIAEVTSSKISDSDKKRIEDKIVNLQLSVLKKGTSLIETLTHEFENSSNYEETGDFEVDINLDYDSLGEFKGNLKLNDYSSKASGFDAQLTGEIETLINAIPNGEEEIKLQLNAIVDFISKEGNMYLLLEKFNIFEEKGVENIKEFLDKAKEIAEESKYIKYSDPESQAGMNILKSINPTNIINDSKVILSKPLVTAYKKEGDKYYLIPTKYACDQFKELSNRFDPFSPKTCTDSQYKNLLKDLVSAGNLYAEILVNGETKIGFIGNKELGLQKNEGSIIFNDNNILELNYEIAELNEGLMIINYNYGKNLDFTFKSYDDADMSLKSILNSKNKFEKINFSFNTVEYNDKINGELTLENNKINGNFSIVDSTKKFSGNITGKTSYDGNLNELAIKYKGIEDDIEFLNGNLSFGNSKVHFENYIETNNNKSSTLISADLDNNYMPINGEIKISVYQKGGSYDYETYEYIYNDDFSEVFKMNIDINDKTIIGATTVLENGEQIINIEHSGNYDLKKFKLNNKFDISELYSKYFNQDGTTTSGNFNIDMDTSDNKNNSNMFINLLFGSDEIFNFSMKNTGKREFKNINISTPTNTIDYKEIFNTEKNNYNY